MSNEDPTISSTSLLPSPLQNVPFPPAESGEHTQSPVQDSESTSSMLTSSDKLSALPAVQSSPNLARLRNGGRVPRRSMDTSLAALPLLDSPNIPAQGLPASVSRTISRASESEGSNGRETPNARVSFDSDRMSLPATLQNIRQAVTNRVTRSDSAVGSSHSHESPSQPPPQLPSPLRKGEAKSPPHSRASSPSRAASPLRRFAWGLHRAHSRDEPFEPVDPFQIRLHWFASPTSTPRRDNVSLDLNCEDTFASCLPLPISCNVPRARTRALFDAFSLFFLDALPRQLYLHALLRLPSLYFTRVARIFEDAEVSKHEIQRMIELCYITDPESDGQHNDRERATLAAQVSSATDEWVPPAVSPALARFKNSWELFVDSLLREWKTLNLVSALLCTAILTMFQVPDAAGDPFTRWAAIFSLIFALMSLTYGCMYIVQFGTMRSMYKASRWAEAAQKTRTSIWWNVWVLLATPAIWLAWSMIAFCVAILSFVWRSGDSAHPPDQERDQLSPSHALIVRVLVSAVFALGILDFVMIVRTFASYSGREPGRRGRWSEIRSNNDRYADIHSERRGRPRGQENVAPSPLSRGHAGGSNVTERTSKEGGGIMGLGLTGEKASTKDSIIPVYQDGRRKGLASPKL
ncbi:hypothetical protein ABKN59_000004 [Abortiporus biennis]